MHMKYIPNIKCCSFTSPQIIAFGELEIEIKLCLTHTKKKTVLIDWPNEAIPYNYIYYAASSAQTHNNSWSSLFFKRDEQVCACAFLVRCASFHSLGHSLFLIRRDFTCAEHI